MDEHVQPTVDRTASGADGSWLRRMAPSAPAIMVGVVLALAIIAIIHVANDASITWAADPSDAPPTSMSGRGAEAFPDTSLGVHVFDDQLPGTLPPALVEFVAGHVDGAQKLPRSLADELHARNEDFVLLQYRLGIGYRVAADGCERTGEYVRILDGDEWVREWPAHPDPDWFAGAAPGDEPRYLCDWGWFLVDTDAPGWRRWFAREVAGQLERTGSDGVFLDSVSPPNQLGTWDPPLPALDATIEKGWSRRIGSWLGWVRGELGVPVVANAGAWVTSRDTTDYSGATGVMIEGFALPWEDVLIEDWALQMDRALSVVRDGGVLLAQAYPDPDDVSARMFVVGSYLLVKGDRTFVNLEVAVEPTWFPEYDMPLGPAVDPVPETIDVLRDGDIYVRRYRDATVVVNPSSAEAVWIPQADHTYARLVPEGGGVVPENGTLPTSWGLRRVPVEAALTLGPREAAVLVPESPLVAAVLVPESPLVAAVLVPESPLVAAVLVPESPLVAAMLVPESPLVAAVLVPESPPVAATSRDSASWSLVSASLKARLAADHRDGRTFLTWDERGDLHGETYRVHRSSLPIESDDLGSGTLLAEVGEGSARVWSDRTLGPHGWRWRYLERAVIEDGADPLPPGRGLLVWTPDAADFGGTSSGQVWYAVETVGTDGERVAVAMSEPVLETGADPRPIHVQDGAAGRSHLMLQFMDLSDWNPTFHAPHARNTWLGFEAGAPGVDDALAYAYTYVVAEPEPAICPDGVVPDRLPVILDLHGWQGNDYPPDLGPSPWYCAVQVRPVDSSETWWFGFAAGVDYRRGETPSSGDRVVNYTEQRVLRMVHDLLRDPVLGLRVDPERVYVYGHSMGGSGALALALRYPRTFAAAYASEPMTDIARSGDGGGTDWRSDVDWKWGSVADDLPVEIASLGDWTAGIERYSGTGVYSWQDHAQNVLARRADESVPLGVAHGILDEVVEWPTQGEPFYPALEASSRAFGGAIRRADHTWLGFAGLPTTLAEDDSLIPFDGLRVRLSESVPAFSDDTADPAWPPAGEVNMGAGIAWSASWEPWDGPPLDTAAAWSMAFRAVDGLEHEVDITPRRLQQFRIEPAVHYTYEISAVLDGSTIRTGTVTADVNGLLTVAAVPVDGSGVRLAITSP